MSQEATIELLNRLSSAEGDLAARDNPERRYRVEQHLGWLRMYILGMTPENWRDMQLRAERQLDQLSAELGIVTVPTSTPI